MYWLVLIFLNQTPAMVIIPEKYSDLAQCQSAGMKAEIRHICVPATEPVKIDFSKLPPCTDPSGSCPFPQNDNMPKCIMSQTGLECK